MLTAKPGQKHIVILHCGICKVNMWFIQKNPALPTSATSGFAGGVSVTVSFVGRNNWWRMESLFRVVGFKPKVGLGETTYERNYESMNLRTFVDDFCTISEHFFWTRCSSLASTTLTTTFALSARIKSFESNDQSAFMKTLMGIEGNQILAIFSIFFQDLVVSWNLQVRLHNKKYHQIIAKACRIQRNCHQKQPEGRTQFPALTPLSQQGAREAVSWLPVAPGGLANQLTLQTQGALPSSVLDLWCHWRWMPFHHHQPQPEPPTTTRTCYSLLTHPGVTPICDLAPEEVEELLHLALHPITIMEIGPSSFSFLSFSDFPREKG